VARQARNFPQAFSHLALINAVMHVIHAESGATYKFSAGMASPQPRLNPAVVSGAELTGRVAPSSETGEVPRTPRIPVELTTAPFTLDAALRPGLSKSALKGHSWRRLGPELHCWVSWREDTRQILRALQPKVTAFSGRTAAWLHGIDMNPAPIEVVVPPGSGLRSRTGLEVHRARPHMSSWFAPCPRQPSRANGRFVGRADLFYPQARLAIEYDGSNHRERMVEDNRRQDAIVNAGYRLLRFTGPDLSRRPEVAVALVRAGLQEDGRERRQGQRDAV
jgi:uncharacterized protein DUF559